MASQCVNDLRHVSRGLEKDGWPVSANVCRHAADRMERMEELIVSLKDSIKDDDDDPQQASIFDDANGRN